MTELHVCAVEGCGEVIPMGMLMCRPHWYQVPKALRDRVWETWNAVRRGGVKGETWPAYEEARDAAIASVPRGPRRRGGRAAKL